MFTKHKGYEAALWDGEYHTYAHLIHEEAEFVGVLDDSTGQEVLKVFDGTGWVSCNPGQYVTKTWNGVCYNYGVTDNPYRTRI